MLAPAARSYTLHRGGGGGGGSSPGGRLSPVIRASASALGLLHGGDATSERTNTENLRVLMGHPNRARVTHDPTLLVYVVDGAAQYDGLLRPLERVVAACTLSDSGRAAGGGAVRQARRRREAAALASFVDGLAAVVDPAQLAAARAGLTRNLMAGARERHVAEAIEAAAALFDCASVAAAAGAVREPARLHGDGVSLTGRQHGTVVHRQLEHFVNAYRDMVNGPVAHTDADVLWARVTHACGGEVDACVHAIMRHCTARDLIPLASEYHVFCEQLRIATSADLLAYERATRRLVLLEVKTGLPKAPTQGDLAAPFVWPAPLRTRALPGGELTMHHLQVVGTYALLRAWGVRVHAAAILYVPHGGAVHEVPVRTAFVRATLTPLFAALQYWRHVSTHGALPDAP